LEYHLGGYLCPISYPLRAGRVGGVDTKHATGQVSQLIPIGEDGKQVMQVLFPFNAWGWIFPVNRGNGHNHLPLGFGGNVKNIH